MTLGFHVAVKERRDQPERSGSRLASSSRLNLLAISKQY
jgi:hypothetical protein